MTLPSKPGTKSQLVPWYPFVQNSLLGGAPAADGNPLDNPNPFCAILGNKARVIPVAGAACYPVLVEDEHGAQRLVSDSSPVKFGGNRIRIIPRTMARAFGMGAVQLSGGLTDAQVINALYPKPTYPLPFVAGSVTNSAGYVGGLFVVESGEDLGDAPGLTPPFTYGACNAFKLATANPSQTTPIKLPEFINRGTAGTGSGGIGAVGAAFLGCGEGTIRHVFPNGSGWTDVHTLYKWYLDPFSGGWAPGGSLQIGPGGNTKGSVAVVEETINLQLPTWLFLQLDQVDGGGDVLWTATITRGGR